MKRQLSDSEPENCDDYDECCSSPDTMQISRKKRRGIIEKRRRDRINNCLVELRRLVPAAFEKQGSAKLEKAEILQMTVEHLRYLQTRDPRGFSDPYAPYGNTKALLDYGIMGYRECAAEITRYLANIEGMEGTRGRIMNHMENLVSQKELAVSAAVAANSQINISQVAGNCPISIMNMPPSAPPTLTIPYAPLTPPRASPDNLSPPANFPGTMGVSELPQFNIAFSIPTTPIISLAPSTNRNIPAAILQSSGFKPVMPMTQPAVSIAPVGIVKPAPLIKGLPCPVTQPLTVITSTLAPRLAPIATSPLTPTSPPNFTWKTDSPHTGPNSPRKTCNTTATKAPFRPWADSTATNA